MDIFTFQQLKEKAKKKGIDVFEVTERKVIQYTVHYHDGEMDFDNHELVEKTVEGYEFDTLDNTIDKAVRRIGISTAPEMNKSQENEIDKLLEYMCKGISDFLHNNNKYNPHTQVIISGDRFDIVQGIAGKPIERGESK